MAGSDATSMLASVPFFSGLDEKKRKNVASLGKELSFKPGDKMVDEGTTGVGFYLILDGKAEVRKGAKVLASLGKGQFFGEMSLIDKEYRSATARAKTDARLIQLTNDSLHVFAKRYRNGFTWVVVNIARMLSARLRDTNRRLMERG